jgi:alcohol dehydrogenase YqhD (iron-dependent ADH family)
LQGIESVGHQGVSCNPKLSHVEEGRRKAIEYNVDGILAVGGGSVIDEAKTIALGARVPCTWDCFCGKPVPDALPVFAIPTIAGSGSEANGGAVITNDADGRKFFVNSPLLYPKVALVNPELTFTLSAHQMRCEIMDAYCHLAEVYYTATGGDKRFIRLLMEEVKDIHTERDYDTRARFFWLSILASSGIANKGLTGYSYPCHAIAHAVSSFTDASHGEILGVLFPAWVLLRQITTQWPYAFLRSPLQNIGIKESQIPAIADMVLSSFDYQPWKRLTREEIVEVLENAL